MVPFSVTRVSTVRSGFWKTMIRMLSPDPSWYSGCRSCAVAATADSSRNNTNALCALPSLTHPPLRSLARRTGAGRLGGRRKLAAIFYFGRFLHLLHLLRQRLAHALVE